MTVRIVVAYNVLACDASRGIITRNSSGDEIAKRDLMIGGDLPDSPV